MYIAVQLTQAAYNNKKFYHIIKTHKKIYTHLHTHDSNNTIKSTFNQFHLHSWAPCWLIIACFRPFGTAARWEPTDLEVDDVHKEGANTKKASSCGPTRCISLLMRLSSHPGGLGRCNRGKQNSLQ